MGNCCLAPPETFSTPNHSVVPSTTTAPVDTDVSRGRSPDAPEAPEAPAVGGEVKKQKKKEARDGRAEERIEWVTRTLQSSDFRTLARFTYNDLLVKAKVVDVHDGDTVTLVFFPTPTSLVPVKHSCRLFGIDAPELIPRMDTPHRELHKLAGVASREILRRQLFGCPTAAAAGRPRLQPGLVWIRFTKEEKYGRTMGRLFLVDEVHSPLAFRGDEICLNDWLVTQGCAQVYNGKTGKPIWKKDQLQAIVHLDAKQQ